jgi:hypothetical protein
MAMIMRALNFLVFDRSRVRRVIFPRWLPLDGPRRLCSGQAGDLDGELCTADAAHGQREHATELHERGAHYPTRAL